MLQTLEGRQNGLRLSVATPVDEVEAAADKAEVEGWIAALAARGVPVLCVEVQARGREFWELNNPEDVPRIEAMMRRMGLD